MNIGFSLPTADFSVVGLFLYFLRTTLPVSVQWDSERDFPLGLEEIFMTTEQKAKIEEWRRKSHGYVTIAKALGLSVSSVKAYCQRHGLAGNRSNADSNKCKGCGKPIRQASGRKHIKFCSSACRQTWWNTHQHEVRRKAVYSYTCTHCGKSFTAYGNKHRKYCSHACYVVARFGGGSHER